MNERVVVVEMDVGFPLSPSIVSDKPLPLTGWLRCLFRKYVLQRSLFYVD